MEILLLRTKYLGTTRGVCLKSQKVNDMNKAKNSKNSSLAPNYSLKNIKCLEEFAAYIGEIYFQVFAPYMKAFTNNLKSDQQPHEGRQSHTNSF